MAGRGLECHVQSLSFSISGRNPGSDNGCKSAALYRLVSTMAWLAPLDWSPCKTPVWGLFKPGIRPREWGTEGDEKFDSASCALGPSLILMSPSKSHLLMRSLMVTD